MQIRHEAIYDADAATVRAMLTSEEWNIAKSEAIDASDITVSVEPRTDGGAAVKLVRTVSPDLPGFAKKVVGNRVTLVDDQQWPPADADGGCTATATGTLEGHSSGFRGTLRIEPRGEKTAVMAVGEVKVSVPLIGGKLEKMVAGMIADMLDSDERVAHSWLAAH